MALIYALRLGISDWIHGEVNSFSHPRVIMALCCAQVLVSLQTTSLRCHLDPTRLEIVHRSWTDLTPCFRLSPYICSGRHKTITTSDHLFRSLLASPSNLIPRKHTTSDYRLTTCHAAHASGRGKSNVWSTFLHPIWSP